MNQAGIFLAVTCCGRDKRNGCLDWFRQQNLGLDYKVFLGDGCKADRKDEVVLNVADTYQLLPWKVQAFFQWVLDQPQEYSHIFKTDCDSLVWLDRLSTLDLENYDYIGNFSDGKFPILRSDSYAGNSYIVSRQAAKMHVAADVKKVSGCPQTYPPFDAAWIEDEFTGKVLNKARRLHTEKFQMNLAGRMYNGSTQDLIVLGNSWSADRGRR